MIFSKLSNNKKIELLESKIRILEEDLFVKILDAGFDPDFFEIEEFKQIYLSIEDEENIDNYKSQKSLNKSLDNFIMIKNKIKSLEENNGI